MAENNKIDVVISWVDGNDPVWQEEKNSWKAKKTSQDKTAVAVNRYREWDNLQYVFRGIEKNMPWVNNVYLVTWGHLPKWLNTEHPNLHIINHKEYIPNEYLPTFNSSVIEIHLHRIPGIAENFLYFNDDMFTIKPTKSTDFFVDGKPSDLAALSPQPMQRDVIANIETNNLGVLNTHFTVNDVKKNKKLWLDFRHFGSYAVRTLLFMKFSTIIGVFEPHLPIPCVKSTMQEVWNAEFDVHDKTSKNKFREATDVSIWLTRQWQLMKGEFVPRSKDFGKLLSASNIAGLDYCINNKKCKVICINDDARVSDFETNKREVNSRLEKILPEKSKFEI